MPAAGWQVTGWTGAKYGDEYTDACNIVIMDGTEHVTVEFECIKRELTTAVTGSGTIDPCDGFVHKYCDGERVSLVAVPAAGWQVTGWTGAKYGGAYADPCNTVTMSEDRSVSVEFERVGWELTIEVINGQGGTVDPCAGVHGYLHGDEAALAADPNAGWQVAWTGVDEVEAGDPNRATVTMTRDRTVTVEFEQVQYWLETSVVGATGGAIAPASGLQDLDSGVALTATPVNEYWYVAGWTGIDPGSNIPDANQATVTMAGDMAVTVDFEPTSATFDLTTVVIGGHGTLEPDPNSFEAGSVVQLTAWPDAAYVVDYWLGTDDDGLTTTVNSVQMDADKTVYVKFKPDK